MCAESADRVYARRWKTLGVLCLSLAIVIIGNSSLNVAIPRLSRELDASTSQLQWVVAVYGLVFAGLLFTTGALGDRLGRKGILQLGLVIYLVGVVAAAASDAIWQLIACRAVMGVGAACIMPSTLSILVNVFPPEERTKAIAVWASITGATGCVGPVVSGWLLGHFWYGSIFLVNVPVLLLALVAGRSLVPSSKDPDEAPLDPVGAILSIVGISTLVYALIQAPEIGWDAPATTAAFTIAALVLVGFVVWERQVAHPMLDMRLFKNPAYATGTSGMTLVFMSMFGFMFLMTQYLQFVLGYSPLSAALHFLPTAPIVVVLAPMTPRLSARIGANRVVALGMASVALGLVVFSRVPLRDGYGYVLVALVALSVGAALAMSPMTASIMSAVPPARAGAGSAMNDVTREFGTALGVALMGSLAASRYVSSLASMTVDLPLRVRQRAGHSLADGLAAGTDLGGPAGRALRASAERAFVDGVQVAVIVGAVLAAAAAVIVLRTLPHHAVHRVLYDENTELAPAGFRPAVIRRGAST